MVLLCADAEPGTEGPPEVVSTPAAEVDGLHVPARVLPRGRGPGKVDHRANADGHFRGLWPRLRAPPGQWDSTEEACCLYPPGHPGKY